MFQEIKNKLNHRITRLNHIEQLKMSCKPQHLHSDNSDATEPKIVFACKSNTCRSQIAEGFANLWLEEKKNVSVPIKRHITVVSVALDEASLFTDKTGQENLARVRKYVKAAAIEIMLNFGVDIQNYTPKAIAEILPIDENKCNRSTEEVDKDIHTLVILCSCGEELKRKLIRRARNVVEWNIDAPTTCFKAGERNAYHRVGLEIKNEVELLMQRISGDVY